MEKTVPSKENDLNCLARTAVPLEILLWLAMEEHGTVCFDRLFFSKGLVDFDEADRDAQPILLWPIDRNEVKAVQTEEVKRIAEQWI
jgi:hypothetical protein